MTLPLTRPLASIFISIKILKAVIHVWDASGALCHPTQEYQLNSLVLCQEHGG
jgi:hypothetical protein